MGNKREPFFPRGPISRPGFHGFWVCTLVALGWIAPAVWAQTLTPLEKAMKALAEKEHPATATATAVPAPAFQPGPGPQSNTRSAQAQPALPVNAPAAAPGNSMIASAPGASAMAAAQGATETAAAPAVSPADAMALTLNATAEEIVASWSNTAVAWKNFGGYVLWRGAVDEATVPLNALPMATNTFRDTSVTAQPFYIYQLVAVDTAGVTLIASHEVQARLAPSRKPDTPVGVQTSTEEERSRILWNPVQRTSHAVAGYAVYRSNTAGAEGRWINPKLITKTEFFDDTGAYGQTYAYQVAAVDAWGITGEASTTVTAYARERSRNGLILMSTAYRGFGRKDRGLNGDLQFTYYIGTLYGDQDKSLSSQSLYLDPISLWLLTADAKYTALTEDQAPLALAVGAKTSLSLFAGQQSSTGGSFTFSQKSTFNTLWGGYLALSRSFGNWGLHTGYLLGTEGNAVYYLSKYLEPSGTRHLVYAGADFPLVRRMNMALEVLYPLNDQGQSNGHPILINTHVDRLFNFDISYLHWDQGWALLGYFNLRFTLFPGGDR